ncbi:sigma-70 family RNA polymerase sigma factor [Cytophagaceae bacterium ABcell3]|nr:sigma-70 family RNA polymerase sigma factor [Cytophagaceae bacterium ABcell3]
MQNTDGKEIIDAIKSGNNQFVLARLYKTVLPNVLNYIIKNSGDEEEAKDIFQDAVLVFYNQVKMGKFNEKYEIGGFIFTVAKNLWINRAKRKSRMSRMLADTDVFDDNNVLKDLITKEKSSAISEMLGKIDKDCRKLLRYSTYEKLSMKEICAKMGFSSENVAKTYNYRCKQKLVKLVKNNQSVMELFRS